MLNDVWTLEVSLLIEDHLLVVVDLQRQLYTLRVNRLVNQVTNDCTVMATYCWKPRHAALFVVLEQVKLMELDGNKVTHNVFVYNPA